MSLLRIPAPVLCIAPALCILLAPWLTAASLPRFEPQPLLVSINDPNANHPVKAQYLVVGQAALEAPIRIEPASPATTSFTQRSDLFDFIQYYVSRTKTLENVEDVLEFSHVADPELFAKFISKPETRKRLLDIYHGVNYMEYVFGWFDSPDIFYALLLVYQDTEPRYMATVAFIFRDDGWKVLSGFKASGQILGDMTSAVWRGDYEQKLKLHTIPDSLRTDHQAQIDSRSVVKTK